MRGVFKVDSVADLVMKCLKSDSQDISEKEKVLLIDMAQDIYDEYPEVIEENELSSESPNEWSINDVKTIFNQIERNLSNINDDILKKIGDQVRIFESDNILFKNYMVLSKVFSSGDSLSKKKCRFWEEFFAYNHASREIGFFEDSTIDSAIQPAGKIKPETSLLNQTVDIKIFSIYAWKYPGIFGKKYEVLFNYDILHELTNGKTEKINFNQKYDLKKRSFASIKGKYILKNLKVTDRGINVYIKTINVQNKDDTRILELLNSDAVNNGVELLSTFQPVIKPFIAIGKKILEQINKSNKNRIVQEIDMSLDLNQTAAGPKLREGNYIIVQYPSGSNCREPWDWSKWKWNSQYETPMGPNNSRIEWNYIIFSVVRSPTR
ncbi:MAG: hypothetical protein ACTSRW_07500 [Candidatus Helarchaeota archaeon]